MLELLLAKRLNLDNDTVSTVINELRVPLFVGRQSRLTREGYATSSDSPLEHTAPTTTPALLAKTRSGHSGWR